MANDRFYPLKLAAVTPETDQAVCLSFAVPDDLCHAFRFTQGQYLTLKSVVAGAEVRRCYSICSGVNDGELKVAVKRVHDGVFSNYANEHLRAGDTLEVMPPQGDFFTQLDPASARHYMCIAAGSGITPILSIVKSVLETEPKSEVTLIFGNQRTSTIMFRDALAFLKNRFMSRLNIIHILSREEQESDVLFGRIDNRKGGELARRRLIDIAGTDEFFLCGPESMISEVSRGLRAEGVDESHIHYELFCASAEDARAAIEKHHSRARHYGGRVSDVTVTVGGRRSRFELTADGENILDGALSHGVDVPFSCKGGVCATCKAKLLEGDVDMDLNHSLSDAEVADGYILTCQSHPISERVVVDYDIN